MTQAALSSFNSNQNPRKVLSAREKTQPFFDPNTAVSAMGSDKSSLLVLLSLLLLIVQSTSHEESGEWSCEPDLEARVIAEFNPAIVTVDGRGEDWKDVDGFEFSLLPALDPDQENAYKGGKMTVKVTLFDPLIESFNLDLSRNVLVDWISRALHDGRDVYFLLQVPGDYAYSKGENGKCPSVALMFQVGEEASYHSMGGCKESLDTCSNKTCKGHEVDIMHFSIGNAIPGRLYGRNPVDIREGNGGDIFGHLVDVYAWNPHCRYLDGISPSGNDTSAQNNWNGAWWHDSLKVQSGYVEADSPYTTSGQKGTYYFEFSRPLRTMDRLQQDAQFTIGLTSKIAVAFWYPVDGNPWHGSGHYSVSCDWLPFEISPGSSKLQKGSSGNSWGGASAFSLVLSVVAFCVSIFVGYWVSKNKPVQFMPMDHL